MFWKKLLFFVLRQNPHIWSISDLNILKTEKCFFEFFSTKTVKKVSLNFLDTKRSICTHLAHQNFCYGGTKKTEKISLVISPEQFIMKTPIPLVISPETGYNKNSRIRDFFESVRNPWNQFLNLIFLFQKTSFAPKICFQWKK